MVVDKGSCRLRNPPVLDSDSLKLFIEVPTEKPMSSNQEIFSKLGKKGMKEKSLMKFFKI